MIGPRTKSNSISGAKAFIVTQYILVQPRFSPQLRIEIQSPTSHLFPTEAPTGTIGKASLDDDATGDSDDVCMRFWANPLLPPPPPSNSCRRTRSFLSIAVAPLPMPPMPPPPPIWSAMPLTTDSRFGEASCTEISGKRSGRAK